MCFIASPPALYFPLQGFVLWGQFTHQQMVSCAVQSVLQFVQYFESVRIN